MTAFVSLAACPAHTKSLETAFAGPVQVLRCGQGSVSLRVDS